MCLYPRVEEPKSEVNKTVRAWNDVLFLHVYICSIYHVLLFHFSSFSFYPPVYISSFYIFSIKSFFFHFFYPPLFYSFSVPSLYVLLILSNFFHLSLIFLTSFSRVNLSTMKTCSKASDPGIYCIGYISTG